MDKEKVIEMLYEYATGRLEDEDIRLIESELDNSIELQEELKNLREILGLLDDTNPPKPSLGFKSRLKSVIEKKGTKKHSVAFLDVVFKPFQIIVPLGILGLIAVSFAFILVYRVYFPETYNQNIKEVGPIFGKTVEAVKNPIIIEAKDVKESYLHLNELILSYKGVILRRKTFNYGVTLVINVPESNEDEFLDDLVSVGEVKTIDRAFLFKEGYKDKEGNIVIVIKELRF